MIWSNGYELLAGKIHYTAKSRVWTYWLRTCTKLPSKQTLEIEESANKTTIRVNLNKNETETWYISGNFLVIVVIPNDYFNDTESYPVMAGKISIKLSGNFSIFDILCTLMYVPIYVRKTLQWMLDFLKVAVKTVIDF